MARYGHRGEWVEVVSIKSHSAAAAMLAPCLLPGSPQLASLAPARSSVMQGRHVHRALFRRTRPKKTPVIGRGGLFDRHFVVFFYRALRVVSFPDSVQCLMYLVVVD